MDAALAHRAWTHLETLNAVTYFCPEPRRAAKDLGLKGYWMGYFGFRAAPMGAVPAAVVDATFHNFAPSLIHRAVPDVWTLASPADLLAARSASAAASLRRLAPDITEVAPAVIAPLRRVIDAADGSGRPLFAANRAIALSEDPVEALWQTATTIREQRGDGHVALLVAAGLDGCEAHVLANAVRATQPADMAAAAAEVERSRHWTAEAWGAAIGRLKGRRLVDAHGMATPEGRDLRGRIEDGTNVLAGAALDAIGSHELGVVLDALHPIAVAVAVGGEVAFPNPMGLPKPS